MKRIGTLILLLLCCITGVAEARRVVVRTTHTRVRVRPAVYLPPVRFTTVRVASVPATARVWSGSEELDRRDGWTDFTLDVDRRGDRLVLEVEDGPAQIRMAEVVFDNGETQVVDFDESTRPAGLYALLDFRNGRKVDHVRIIARAARDETEIKLHLAS